MTVRHLRGQYEVTMLSASEVLKDFGPNDRILIDENVLRLWPDLGFDTNALVVPAGEASKSLDVFGRACSWLASSGALRSTRLFPIGGGVVGDLAGYVAASYMRGIPLVMVPTTLLAMVDSSVGGKVAIDIPEGKNLVGAFWPPQEVRIAIDFLDTLPDQELLNGSAEVWKYGWILDEELLTQLEQQPVDRTAQLSKLVERCISLKAQVVEADEEERTGLRAILNFGHTVGHAIEATMAYKGWSHGECISVGMVVESKIGEQIGVTPPGTSDRVRNGLQRQGLPVEVPEPVSTDMILDYARRDKKSDGSGLAFSLLLGPGECKLVRSVPETAVRHVLTAP